MKMRIRILLLAIFVAVTARAQDSTPQPGEGSADIETYQKGFAWGIDTSSGIDITANNMTYTGIDAYFGYKSRYLRFIGVGAGINMMMSNASASYPVYVMLQTNFKDRPTLCFLNIKGGVSFNRIYNYTHQTGGYGHLGLGFNLAISRTFRSHILLGYTVISRKDFQWDGGLYRCPVLQFATFGIGVSF